METKQTLPEIFVLDNNPDKWVLFCRRIITKTMFLFEKYENKTKEERKEILKEITHKDDNLLLTSLRFLVVFPKISTYLDNSRLPRNPTTEESVEAEEKLDEFLKAYLQELRAEFYLAYPDMVKEHAERKVTSNED